MDTFGAVAADPLLDTESYHQIVVSWSKHYYDGHPKIYIDGSEVSSYAENNAYRGNMAYLDAGNQNTITDWAPVIIGGTFGISESSASDSSMGWFLDADLDEVILYAGRLIPEEVLRLHNHLIEGVQDGDRWYIDDPNLRMVTGGTTLETAQEIRGDRISDRCTGDWLGYKEYYADWRRDPTTGLFGWVFVPVEYSAVYWENKRGRLDSWLPDDFYDLWGDYGVQGTGDFNL